MKQISLSDGEWKIMNLLWKESPKTVMQITRELEKKTGWSKHTVITMLHRMEKKGAVSYTEEKRAKQYYPTIAKDQASIEETKEFLDKVFEGSFSLMVNAMASSHSLSRKEIEELYEILRKEEEG